ncbi:ATP-binding protein [Microcella sp.]|uniref:hybrid sensor histidine kinase/response regulator n=1 Tax=Microcella sp. TaxID=1913979 RepID=UPI00391C95F1
MKSQFERWSATQAPEPGDWLSIAAANGLRSLLSDSDDDPVVIFDDTKTIVQTNAAARVLLDGNGAVKVGTLAVHEHFTRVTVAAEDVLAGESVRVVYTAQLPAGGMRSMVGTGIPLRNAADGRVVGGVFLVRAARATSMASGSGIDAEDRLFRLAGRLARFDGWTLDLADESIRWMHEGGLRLKESLSDAVTIDELAATLAPADAGRWQRSLARAVVEQNIFDVFVEHRLGTDDRVVMRWTGKPVLDPTSGQPRYVSGVAQDVTEIFEAQRARDQVERRLYDTLAALSDGVIRFDEQRNVAYANHVACQMLSLAADEAIGSSAEATLASVPAVLDLVRDIGSDSVSASRIERVISTGEFDWAVTAYRVDDSITLLMRDVTEEQRAYRAAQVAERELSKARRWEALGTLAGGLAHDLNNALTPITIATKLLDRAVVDEQHRSAITIIEQAVTRAKDMTAQVMSFSQVGRGPRGPVDLRALFDEVVRFSADVMGPEVDFQTEIAEDLPWVDVVETELYQALTNLLINARDAVLAREDDGQREVRLTVTTGAPSHHVTPWPHEVPETVVTIAVTDTGVGMPPSVEERIFEPFFTTKGPGRGTGLGLPTAQRVVRWSGGRLLVHTAQGVGTTFAMELPISSARTRTSPASFPASSTALHGNGRRVLVLDDEVSVTWAIQALLEESGYVVTSVDSTAAAIDQIERGPRFDAVIADLNLAGESGLEVAHNLQRRESDTALIIMTGSGIDNPVPASLAARVAAVVRKPFAPERLLSTLADALARREEDAQ